MYVHSLPIPPNQNYPLPHPNRNTPKLTPQIEIPLNLPKIEIYHPPPNFNRLQVIHMIQDAILGVHRHDLVYYKLEHFISLLAVDFGSC